MATKFKLTDEQAQAIRDRIFAHHNVKHEFIRLADDDMRTEAPCSNSKSSKCSGEKATWLRANKLYCDACKVRCDNERSKIVRNRAMPALTAAIKHATTQAKFDQVMAQY